MTITKKTTTKMKMARVLCVCMCVADFWWLFIHNKYETFALFLVQWTSSSMGSL